MDPTKHNSQPERETLFRSYLHVFRQDGKEIVEINGHSSDSVFILCLIRDTMQVVFVEQDRPAMSTPTNRHGRIIELPAGRFDCQLGVQGLAVQEMKEEAGITVREDQVELVYDEPLALSAGVLTEKSWFVYLQVASSQVDRSKSDFGLAAEGESTHRLLIDVDLLGGVPPETIQMALALTWFRYVKLPEIRKADADNAITH